MNPQEPILPEIFEDVINNFIIDENNLLMNYVEVHDVKLEYYASFENYILFNGFSYFYYSRTSRGVQVARPT